MDSAEFVEFAKATIDYVANYTDTVRSRNVLPDVEPGYLSKLLPKEAPQKSEKWQEVLKDVERCIMPGVTHWNSPHFHAYFPTGNSYPSLVADIVSSAIGCIGFSWIASPACTELEVITCNWLGQMLGLPSEFLNCSNGTGGGVIQGSASECTFICLLAAKERTVRRMKQLHPETDEDHIRSKLVSYTSSAAFICPEFRYLMTGIQYVDSFNINAHKWLLTNFDASVMCWIASPACTELEVITCNWLGQMLGLPSEFLNCSNGTGGGVIQGSASECTFICLLAAKERTVRRMKQLHPETDEDHIRSKLVSYTSNQSNSSVEKAGILGSLPMRLLPVDDKCSLRGETLKKAIQEDLEKGLIPCYVVATLGTTSTCAFDNIDEIGLICKEYDMWLHVDAAYAGAAFICPEFRYLMTGIQYVDSFNINAHKWLLTNFDASVMWVKDSRRLVETFSVNRIYLSHDKEGLVPDYRNWQIPLGRRFRSLKLWFVMRIYGVQGLQEHIRYSIKLAHLFETYVRSDDRFEIVTEVIMGLVCFRIKGDNSLTKELLERLQATKKVYLIAGTHHHKLVARFVVCSRTCREEDIAISWNEIRSQATEILETKLNKESIKNGVKLKDDIATRIVSLNLESKKSMQKIS
ncbi:Aromatic-L-amino-acid decarboxylase [Cyphomyrmex costatus]|uniref:Aromatic-L-amino-acid decarboxylase n=1 Tax=Cyphomyrmex costatus TaxID=456900 RepID=A0A195CJ63_9HYME|nr:Aromatic-L-amino-acid decarboxylase [Cyphomyrmex costatus]